MFRKFMAQFRKPEGLLGGLLARMMNVGHGPMTREVVKRLGITSADIVLDIGCGGGGAIDLMAKAGARVYGVDYSDASLRASLKKNGAAVRSGRVRIEKADVRALPFSEEMFTLITAFETVFFWDRLEECFQRIHGLLKPGGRLAIALEAWKRDDGTINCPEVFLKNLDMDIRSAGEYRDLLFASGFASVAPIYAERGNWLCVMATK